MHTVAGTTGYAAKPGDRGDRVVAPARILVVDDSPIARRTLCRVLQSSEWLAVHSASNGREALDYLWWQPFQAMVTDLEMPGVDGLTLLSYAARRYPAMGRIAYSAHPRTLDLVGTLADRALRKPARPAQLFDALSGVVPGFNHRVA